MIGHPFLFLAAGALAAGGGLLSLRDGDGDAAPPPPMTGAALFQAKGCATCHTGPDTTSPVGAGPSLAAAPSWAGSRIEGVAAEDYLRQSIVAPQVFRSPFAAAGSEMPTLALGPDELDALVAYLLAEPPG